MKSGAAACPRWLRVITAALMLAASGCGGAPAAYQQTAAASVPVGRPTVVGQVPHDPTAFTEGLEFDGPALYESTGELGRSQLRQLDPTTGALLRSAALPLDVFGEGITIVGDRIWQLTFQNGFAIEWDKASFTPLRRVPMQGEGWGLCHDGKRLVRSDGTARLRFHDPTSFAETGSVPVTYQGKPLSGLNALGCVDGQVWANLFPTDDIVRVDPQTGRVTALFDAGQLFNGPQRPPEAVLNGIAYAGGGEFLLTGKDWPTMFRVRFDGA